MQPISDLTAIALYYSNAGAELLLSDEARQAIGPLRIAVALDSYMVAAWVNLGVALRRSGDLNGAEEAYKTAVGLEPSAFDAFRSLAALLRVQGRPQEAAAVLTAGEKAVRPDAFTYWALAERSLRDGRIERARYLYRTALGASQEERP